MLSITLICLNGSYAMGSNSSGFSFDRKNFNYLNDDLPPTMDPKYDWKVKDT